VKKEEEKKNMTDNKTLVLEDRHAVEEMYKFAKDLLADYSACKTELARSGLKKSLEMLIDKIGDAHARAVDAKLVLERELEATKAKLPKSKEEITKILHEAGFHELEEVEGGTWHGNVPSPELTPKQYAELYRRLYGEMTKADERKLDRDIKKMEEEEQAAAEALSPEQIFAEAKNGVGEKEDDGELDPKKQMTPEEFFDGCKMSDAEKEAASRVYAGADSAITVEPHVFSKSGISSKKRKLTTKKSKVKSSGKTLKKLSRKKA